MPKNMKTRKGKDGFDYPYTSPDIVVDENGKSTTKKFEEIDSQFKDIAKEYLYNISAISNFKGVVNPKIINIGDSISAVGYHTPLLCSGDKWNQQLANQLEINYGQATNKSIEFTNNTNGCTIVTTGLNKTVVKADTNAEIQLITIPNDIDMYCKIIYSTEPDGGDIEVNDGTKQIITFSCNGETKYNNLSDEFLIPSENRNYKLKVLSGKGYFYGLILSIKSFADENAPHLFFNFATGGRKIMDYTDKELEDMVKIVPSDLLIMSLGANDYNQGVTSNNYKNKVKYTLEKYRELNPKGMILLQLMCGNNATVKGGTSEVLFLEYRQVLRDLADSYNCALIDYDLYMGGYANAKANNWIGDTIHPNTTGYTIMADLLIEVLINQKNMFKEKFANNNRFSYMTISSKKYNYDTLEQRYDLNKVKIRVPNHRGYEYDFYNPQPVVSRAGVNVFPNDVPIGFMVYNTSNNKFYVCTTEAVKDNKGNITAKCVFKPLGNAITADTNDPMIFGLDMIKMEVMNQNGATKGWVHCLQPILDRKRANFPKQPKLGMIVYNTDTKIPMVCTDKDACAWENIGSATIYENNLPTATNVDDGKIAIKRVAGANDMVYICIRQSDGTSDWKKLVLE